MVIAQTKSIGEALRYQEAWSSLSRNFPDVSLRDIFRAYKLETAKVYLTLFFLN